MTWELLVEVGLSTFCIMKCLWASREEVQKLSLSLKCSQHANDSWLMALFREAVELLGGVASLMEVSYLFGPCFWGSLDSKEVRLVCCISHAVVNSAMSSLT